MTDDADSPGGERDPSAPSTDGAHGASRGSTPAESDPAVAGQGTVGTGAGNRTEVLAGDEVPLDLIDSEDLHTAGAEPGHSAARSHRPSPTASATATPRLVESRPVAPAVGPKTAAAPAAPAVDGAASGTDAGVAPRRRPSPVATSLPADDAVVDPAHNAVADTADPAAGADETTSTRSGPGFFARHRHGIVRTVVTLVIAAVVAILLRVFVVQPYYIPSASMEPTLHGCPGCTDDRVVVDKLSGRFRDLHAGDIVVFDKPPNAVGIGDDVLIKRVIAVGGQTLTLKNDRVFVNGAPDDENYLDRSFLAKNCPGRIAQPETGTTRWKIPDDDVFVMGDNRCDSDDSRTFGPIKKDSVVGRAVFIIWPFNRIGGI